MMLIYILLPIVLFTSCGVYKSTFDCPPGKGVGCAPVGEVIDLIVERENGEDLFVKNKGSALLLKKEEQKDPREKAATEKVFYLTKDDSGNFYLVKVDREREDDPR